MTTHSLFLVSLIYSLLIIRNFSFQFTKPNPGNWIVSRNMLSASVSDDITTSEGDINERVINITPKALLTLQDLLSKDPSKPLLRMGVKAGGCSGMSYVMDFITENDINTDDHEEFYEGIRCVVDPKSLLFLYGLQLDYSDELIGGGFKFMNPNAESSCGCGSSFSL